MLLKNTCERIHLIKKLPAISLQASKFTKNELLPHLFQGFQLDSKLLFIVLFLGIISWKDVLCFNGGISFSNGVGRVLFRMEGAPFFSFGWGQKKIVIWGGEGHLPPMLSPFQLWETPGYWHIIPDPSTFPEEFHH